MLEEQCAGTQESVKILILKHLLAMEENMGLFSGQLFVHVCDHHHPFYEHVTLILEISLYATVSA